MITKIETCVISKRWWKERITIIKPTGKNRETKVPGWSFFQYNTEEIKQWWSFRSKTWMGCPVEFLIVADVVLSKTMTVVIDKNGLRTGHDDSFWLADLDGILGWHPLWLNNVSFISHHCWRCRNGGFWSF